MVGLKPISVPSVANFLWCFDAVGCITLLVKIILKVTYNVSSGILGLSLTHPSSVDVLLRWQ